MRKRGFPLLIAAAGVVLVACSDNLAASASCPTLCPGLSVALHDTILDAAISVDTSVAGFPVIGRETNLIIGTLGDTVDTRGIVRFDTLPTRFTRVGAPSDSAIVHVDSATLVLRIDTTAVKPGAPVTFSLYDVDTTASDTAVSALLPLFRPSRLLGSHTFAPESLVDSVLIQFSPSALLNKITNNQRLRIGIQVTGVRGGQVSVGTVENSLPARMFFRPALRGDTAGITQISVALASGTPVTPTYLSADLMDYLIVAKAPSAPANGVLALGGLPGRRIYLGFNLPSKIVDSSTILRATLQLTQISNPHSARALDTVSVFPEAILAGTIITDVSQALLLLDVPGGLGLDTLKAFAPNDSGLREFEMVQLIRVWETTLAAGAPRALGLRTSSEGVSTAQVLFYSSLATVPANRPRLRVTYAPRQTLGSPQSYVLPRKPGSPQ